MSRPRSSDSLLRESLEWLASWPVRLRWASAGRPADEVVELSETAAAMAKLHAQLWRQWQRRSRAKREREEGSQILN
jgi:hypothetical protein